MSNNMNNCYIILKIQLSSRQMLINLKRTQNFYVAVSTYKVQVR